MKAKDWDALLIPGGFGAAKNLSDFGFKGADMSVDKDVAKVMRDFRKAEKVIGLTCIAPIIAAKVFGSDGVKLTLGGRSENFPYAGSIDAAASFGAQMEECNVEEVCTDWVARIVSTPAYMQGDAAPHQVFDGIQTFLIRIQSLIKQQAAVESIKKAEEAKDSRPATEGDLMYQMVVQSVNRMWNDYCTRKDGYLTIEESRRFINDSFGAGLPADKVDEILSKLDTDVDGKISKGDMADFIMKISVSKY